MAAGDADSLDEPLISTPKNEHSSHGHNAESKRATWQHEAKQQLTLALPIIGMNAVQLLLVLTSAAFVGHLGALQLASAQLATSLANALGHYVLVGMALGLETLGGQVVGAGQLDELGHVTHLGLIVLTLLACTISIAWAFAEPLLLALGQDPTLAKEAAKYLHLLIPSLFANAWTQPLVKFLQSLGATAPLAWASTVTLLLHLPSNWFFIFYLGWGMTGAPIATSLAYCLIFTFLLGHILTSGAYSHSTPKLNLSRSFRKAPLFLKLGFFSASMMCLEYVAFDIIYLMAGLLPDPYRLVSALSVAMNTTWLCATTYVGLGNAVSTRVATELGRGSVLGAQRAARVGLGWSVVVGVVATALMLALHRQWPLLFIDGADRQLLDLCTGLMLFASLNLFGDSIQVTAGGVLRGCGRQDLGAVLALASYYAIAVPAAAVGGFVLKWSVWGIFGGMFIGVISQLMLQLTAIAWTNWERQAKLARDEAVDERMGAGLDA
ncbi:MATE efflux family protein [Klebsormidium nitens]|uniref:Protein DETOXIFICATION n=1 Tax=Klebsormidium nitens TaxID=105231 RepID=A0A1Y1IDZ6_KLENI|nr:MATE efflux family protein [Klebsormidium nitens]|eukprot:GAQ87331.1 MATE efflux family protein [Klebsormidium nitens]